MDPIAEAERIIGAVEDEYRYVLGRAVITGEHRKAWALRVNQAIEGIENAADRFTLAELRERAEALLDAVARNQPI